MFILRIICILGLGILLSCGQNDQKADEDTGLALAKKDLRLLPDNTQLVEFERITDPILMTPFELEDLIGDSAELFWRYDLQSFVRADYKDLEKQNQYAIEIYRFPDVSCAFGLYSLLRHGCEVVAIGTEATLDSNRLLLLKDKYVAIINGFGDSPAIKTKLRKLGKNIVPRITGKAAYPSEFKSFPQENKIACSESYFHRFYLNQTVFNAVYTSNYDFGHGIVTLFFMPAGAHEALPQYIDYIKMEGKLNREHYSGNAKSYLLEDPSFGNIEIMTDDNRFVGAINNTGQSLPANFLSTLLAKTPSGYNLE
jgi:hypothetical protein